MFTDSKERLEKQTRAFVKKVSSRDFAKRIQKMVCRGYVENNERYHVPEKKSIGELLVSMQWRLMKERVSDDGWTAKVRDATTRTLKKTQHHSDCKSHGYCSRMGRNDER